MRLLCLALIAALLPLAALAQAAAPPVATLVADRVEVETGNQLVAEGRVEVLYDGVRLQATRITYDQPADRLMITGPITLRDGEDTVVLADMAELDADLQNGVLRSARMVLDQQLQLAATQLARVSGRYTELSNTVASSCEVCAENPIPTWEIRARRVVHDQQERQLYFENAQFRVLGLPIAFFPYLRLPDPTLTRTSGLLIPSIRTTSQLGTGVKVPYFFRLGDHADLTLTPYLSTSTTTLEARYRQAFRFGTLKFDAALTRDDLFPDDTRYYVFGRGRLDLPRDFRLELDIEEVSDEAYLIDYGYSDRDRLETGARLFRARRDSLFDASLSGFETLRSSEIPIRDQLPGVYGTVSYERAIRAGGGQLVLGGDLEVLSRRSSLPTDGRDTARLGFAAEYRRSWLAPVGLLADLNIGADTDVYRTFDDPNFPDYNARLVPHAAATLRLPLQRNGAGGVRHLIEPVVQLAWSDTRGDAVPNEDSILVEFDEGNLFALSRFPGQDRIETGVRANLGVRYTRTAPSGWTLGAVLGRVWREDAVNDLGARTTQGPGGGFSPASGLFGTKSDWLAAAQLRLGPRFAVTARAVFDDDLEMTKNEARLGYNDDRLSLETSYVFLNGDASENRPRDTHELTLETAYRLSRHWTGSFNTRYDFDQDRAQRSGVGLQYRTECITVDLSVSRRFTETQAVSASTQFGFGVSLAGVGNGRADSTYRKTCNG
ncbi:LPS-assembly protein [Palleronia salina]|uniref:LPS-assembly protein LptD n=1 Tax=Palleronia salina TaxID=313368 RepID=A0A1M6HVK6_9RHOB|nr:LPS assembly protein LptD [Palleronia salina]SHJ26282.1 LPS-assembly protein [Palleronia salina]